MSAGAQVAGVDGCRGGWVAAVLAGDRAPGWSFARAVVRATLAELLAELPAARVVAVDIPIGLAEDGWRAADRLARARLGRAGASVFMIPPRAVLETGDHAAATRLCVALTGKGCSRQAWGLRRRIFEAERARAADPRLHEAHPELCFLAMAGEVPLGAGKRTTAGRARRLELLARHGIHIAPARPATLTGGGVAADDVLDAAAVAWTAARIAEGVARPLPPVPEPDGHGWPVAIWC